MSESNDQTLVQRSELYEQLAAIEHERWSDWMKYLFSVASGIFAPDRGPGTFIPAKYAKRWIRQMETPYDELTEQEKQSDREQVDRYWSLIFPPSASPVDPLPLEQQIHES